MQEDFHYYATYCAAYLAGYSHEESMEISYSAQFVDCCSRTLLKRIQAPLSAATTQLQTEMMAAKTTLVGLQDITRIWSAFHFLPYDLYASLPGHSKKYMNKYRLICNSNGDLVKKTVNLAKGSSLQAVGIAMHVLADTWAHKYFAGTPSLVINNTDWHFFEVLDEDEKNPGKPMHFNHNVVSSDDPEGNIYINTFYYGSENTITNLGHGRAGHLPDYSFIKYKYLPAWGEYREFTKDNPSDYMQAFSQMVYAMKCLREGNDTFTFELNTYADQELAPYKNRIQGILKKRQLIASEDWKAFGESLSGRRIDDFDIERYCDEYVQTSNESKDKTFLGRFIAASIKHKNMVANQIFESGNMLAGFSFSEEGFRLRSIRKFF